MAFIVVFHKNLDRIKTLSELHIEPLTYPLIRFEIEYELLRLYKKKSHFIMIKKTIICIISN